jgi:hypothetical protein
MSDATRVCHGEGEARQAGCALLSARFPAAQHGRISSADTSQAKLVLKRVVWHAAVERCPSGHGFSEESPLTGISRYIRVRGGADDVQLKPIAQSLHIGDLPIHPSVAAMTQETEACGELLGRLHCAAATGANALKDAIDSVEV